VIDDGVTGFIVGSMDEAVNAVGRVNCLDRRHIRAVFERRFSAPVMAANHARHYWQLLGGELMRETA
jgi:hypothetical protein